MKRNDKNVTVFYNETGWESDGGTTEDARLFEDLRTCAKEYVSKCRLRVLDHIPSEGDKILDMASGPIQYKEYLEYSKNFRKRYCVDFSSKALADAKKKIGTHGEYCHGDFLEMDFQENFFDCSISLHTIYHIDKDAQEAAIRKLLRITKPGTPVIIIYCNPDTLISRMGSAGRRIKRIFTRKSARIEEKSDICLYFFAHPLDWWDRYRDIANVQIKPWRSLTSHHQKILIPDNKLGSLMLSFLYSMENRFPVFFSRHFQYPMIILRKSTVAGKYKNR